MPTVRDWFDDFAADLVDRSLRTDLPEAGTEYWKDFENSLVRLNATRGQADEASSIVCDLPNLFTNSLRSLVVEQVKKIQARQKAAATPTPGSAAEETSLTPDQLKAFRASIGLSATPGDPNAPSRRRGRQDGAPRPILGRPAEWLPDLDDPIIAKERASGVVEAPKPEEIHLPEDDAVGGWI